MTNKEPVVLETVSEEPLPCPFCAEGTRLVVNAYGIEGNNETPEDRAHEVVCDGCGASGPERAPRLAAIAAWNRRSPVLASRLAIQAPDGWQTTEPPKDGTPVYIRTVQPYRYMPYKAASQQYKRGEKGRWQVMNEYGGWENSHPLGNEWRLESTFAAPNLGATK